MGIKRYGMMKKTSCRKKTWTVSFTAILIPSTLLHTLPQHDSKKSLPMELYQGKIYCQCSCTHQNYFIQLTWALPILSLFFTVSPNSIWLPFHCCLSVTIIKLLIAPSTANVVTATSSIPELTGLAVTKKASSLFEISWTSIAKSDLTPMKEAFHGWW